MRQANWRAFGVLALLAGPTLPVWWLLLLLDEGKALVWLVGISFHVVLLAASIVGLRLLTERVLWYRVGWLLVAVAAITEMAALSLAWTGALVDGSVAFLIVALGWALQGVGLVAVGLASHTYAEAARLRGLMYAGIGWLLIVGLWLQPSQIVVLAGGVVFVGWAYAAVQSLRAPTLIRS